MKARIQGVASQMQLFKFFFCLILSEMILRHSDRLSQTLQQLKLSSVEGHELAMLTVKTLESLRNDENFNMFWLTVEKKRILQNIDEPRLARRRKLPSRLELGMLWLNLHCLQKRNTGECTSKLLTSQWQALEADSTNEA